MKIHMRKDGEKKRKMRTLYPRADIFVQGRKKHT